MRFQGILLVFLSASEGFEASDGLERVPGGFQFQSVPGKFQLDSRKFQGFQRDCVRVPGSSWESLYETFLKVPKEYGNSSVDPNSHSLSCYGKRAKGVSVEEQKQVSRKSVGM